MKKYLLILLIFLTSLQTYAFEDCIITTSEKVSEIKVEDNSILNAYPLVTIENNKNIIFINPHKVGETKVFITKSDNEKTTLSIKVTASETFICTGQDFEALSLDTPPEWLEIDLPPTKLIETGGANG